MVASVVIFNYQQNTSLKAKTMLISLALLAICVAIQSIYGVGLLVFGTPILLLTGMDFYSVLGFLLPSSIMISSLQIYETRENKVTETSLVPLAIIGIFIGVMFLKNGVVPAQTTVIMAVAMFMAAALRSSPKMMKWLGSKIYLYRQVFHFLNAVFHGLSNMGGTLLSIYSTTVYSDKVKTVRCTAIFYFVYASSQIITLTLVSERSLFSQGLLLMPGALLIHLIAGKSSLKFISDEVFYHLATIFFWVAGSVFFVKSIADV